MGDKTAVLQEQVKELTKQNKDLTGMAQRLHQEVYDLTNQCRKRKEQYVASDLEARNLGKVVEQMARVIVNNQNNTPQP